MSKMKSNTWPKSVEKTELVPRRISSSSSSTDRHDCYSITCVVDRWRKVWNYLGLKPFNASNRRIFLLYSVKIVCTHRGEKTKSVETISLTRCRRRYNREKRWLKCHNQRLTFSGSKNCPCARSTSIARRCSARPFDAEWPSNARRFCIDRPENSAVPRPNSFSLFLGRDRRTTSIVRRTFLRCWIEFVAPREESLCLRRDLSSAETNSTDETDVERCSSSSADAAYLNEEVRCWSSVERVDTAFCVVGKTTTSTTRWRISPIDFEEWIVVLLRAQPNDASWNCATTSPLDCRESNSTSFSVRPEAKPTVDASSNSVPSAVDAASTVSTAADARHRSVVWSTRFRPAEA